jgi:hypothetical protein
MKVLSSKVDEEDLEYFYEDLENVDKGLHHIMEINGALMKNSGEKLSAFVGQNLLPHYAVTLLNIADKKDYELVNSVCFICDCLEFGSQALFNQVCGQAGPKFLELIEFGAKHKEGTKYDLLQSCVFGLGLIAQRQPDGQFAQMKQTVEVLSRMCDKSAANAIEEDDEKESMLYMVDNSISTMVKLVVFQPTNGGLVNDQVVSNLWSLLPLTTDVEEARALHLLVLE